MEKKMTIYGIVAAIALLIGAVGCDASSNPNENMGSSEKVTTIDMDSLVYFVQTGQYSTYERIRICEHLCYNLVYTDADKSIFYGKWGLKLAENEKSEKKDSVVSLINCDLGMAYTIKNVYDSAKIYFDEALQFAIQTKNEPDQIYLYNAFGKLYGDQGKYKTSIEYKEKARQLAEKNEIYLYLATILRNIAISYHDDDNFQEAERYLHKSIEIYNTKFENPNEGICADISDTYSNFVVVYIAENKMEEAFNAAQKAYEYAQLSKRLYTEINALRLLSLVYRKCKEDYNHALKLAEKALTLSEGLDNNQKKADCYIEIGGCYFALGDYKNSKLNYQKALRLTEADDLKRRRYLLSDYHAVLAQLKETDEIIATFNLYDSIYVAINNQKVQSTLSDLQLSYETEKKELKIATLEDENRWMTRLSISGGAVLLLALTTFLLLWRWTVQKKRTVEQEKRLAEQLVTQLEQEKQLVATQAVLDGETRERARLARDLHDGLGSLLTGVKLRLLEMKQGVQLEYADVERFDNALGLLDDSVREMRRVAHHLMPDSLSRFGLKPAVNDFCNNLPTVHFSYYGDESRLDPKMEVMIYRCIHELVNNALKHAGADKVIVQLIQEPDRISFTIQDDGRGFDPTTVTNGMGLQNIRTRIASYNGLFDIDSCPGKGTEINVELILLNKK